MSHNYVRGVKRLSETNKPEQPGRLPVVIAGQLEDNPGSVLDNAIEMVAESVQAMLFPDGREFRLVRHYPPWPTLSPTGPLRPCAEWTGMTR